MSVAATYARNSYAAEYSDDIPAAFNDPSKEDTGKAAASNVPGVLIKPEPELRVVQQQPAPQRSALLEQDGETPQAPVMRQQPSPNMLMTPKAPSGMG